MRGLTCMVGAVLLLAACGGQAVIDPQRGGAGGNGSATKPGRYFLSLALLIGKQPAVMVVDVTIMGAEYELEVQPIDASDRRTAVGAPLSFGPFPLVAGELSPEIGAMDLPGEANPISDSALGFDGLALTSERVTPDICGTAAGSIVSPITLPLEGSTFTMVPVATIDDAPEPPAVDCDGNTAPPM